MNADTATLLLVESRKKSDGIILKQTQNEFFELLHNFELLTDTFKSKSIFDIAGYPNYENVCSNILAFYLNPNNEHGLGNLFFSSLMNLASERKLHPNNIRVNREVSTNKGGRLDIVIETDYQIIGIENKIFHHLNNNLSDYRDSINSWGKSNQLDTVKIILSIRKEPESFDFICITYEDYWAKIREQLGSHITTSSQKWVLYLIDFMSSIEKLNRKNMERNKSDQFFIENDERVNALLNARSKFILKLNSKVRELENLIQKPDKCNKQWIYAKSCLVHDFNLSGYSIAFDLYISPQGWELQLFGRNIKSQAYLIELFFISPMCDHKTNLKNSRYILQVYDLSTELEIIKNGLIKWFYLLIQSSTKKNN